MNTSTSFQRDYKVVEQAVVSQLTNEGTNPKGLEKDIANITIGYMVAIKSQWLKVNPKNVVSFLAKYQPSTIIAMQLLEKHSFDSLVKTYRQVNLSPKTKKVLCGLERYSDFIDKVNKGSISLVVKTTKQPKVNALMSAFLEPKPKKALSKPKAKPKAKAKSKDLVNAFSEYDQDLGITRRVIATKSGNGQWTEVFMNEYLKDRALVRVVSDNKTFFGRFLYIRSSKVQKTQFFRIVTKSAKFIDIPVNKIDCVLEFEPIQ